MSPAGGSAPFTANASRSDLRRGRSHAISFLPTRQSCGACSAVSGSSPMMRATSLHVATSRLCSARHSYGTFRGAFGVLPPAANAGELARPTEPLQQSLIDRGVIEQVEVVQAGQGQAVRGLERNLTEPAPTGRALRPHQAVAEKQADRTRSRGAGDEVVNGVRKKRHLVAAVLQELVRVAIAPVLVEQRAVPQVLHAGAAGIEEGSKATGLR